MADLYWVGGTAAWDGTALLKWATSSGGVGGLAIPTAADDVHFDANSGAGTCTISSGNTGCRSLNFTGYTGTFAHASGVSLSIGDASGGALTMSAAMTYTPTGSASAGLRFVATGTNGGTGWPITTAGKAMGVNGTSNQFTGVGGKWVLQDAWTQPAGASLALTGGELNIGSLTHQTGSFNSSGASVKSLTGTGTISLLTTSASTVWNITGSNMTIASTVTTLIGANSTNVRTIATNGVAHGTLTYNRAGSTGGLDITGSGTFTAINFSDASNARTLRFTAGTTTTIPTAAGWNVFGTSGKLMTVTSITAATHTISVASGTVSSDYLSLSQSVAAGGAAFYAGANSTNGGSNTGWTFTAPPSTITATAAAPLGALAAALAATPESPATLDAPLGLLTATAAGGMTHPATADAPLGTMAALAAGTVAHPATGSAPLGDMTATVAATVTRGANLAADLGGMSSTAGAVVDHPAVLAAPLGALNASAGGSVTVSAVADAAMGELVASANAGTVISGGLVADLGSLAAGATGVTESPAGLDAPLGQLAADMSALTVVGGAATAILGDLTGVVAATATTPPVLAAPLGTLDATTTAAVIDVAALTGIFGAMEALIEARHLASYRAPTTLAGGRATSARPPATTVANMRPPTTAPTDLGSTL